MSYYKCKGIVIKNNNIMVDIASSNCFPITYQKCEMVGNNLEQKEFNVFTDLMSGNIHLDTLNNNTIKYEYALLKTYEYLRENNIDSYNDLYHKQYDLYDKIMSEKLGFDITSDYYNNEELKEKYNTFRKNNKDFIENLSFESKYETYKSVYEVFKDYLKEEEPKGEYYLYSNDYGYIKTKGKNGAFYYTKSNYDLDKGNYKKMYCKRELLDYKKHNIEIKRYVMCDTEIKKELEKQEKEKEERTQAKEKIKNITNVINDIESFKNGNLDLNVAYFEEICKLCNIEYKIPKNLIKISYNSWSYNGKHKKNNEVDYIFHNAMEKLKKYDTNILKSCI